METSLFLTNTRLWRQQLSSGNRVNLLDMRKSFVLLPVEQASGAPSSSASHISCTPRAFLAFLLTISCICTLVLDLPALAATSTKNNRQSRDPVLKGLPVTELSAEEAIQHALNRLTYGPRPGDVERVRQIGLAKWIDQQLNPRSIDDSALEARLNVYPTLTMTTAQLLEEYPNPNPAAKLARQSNQESNVEIHSAELNKPWQQFYFWPHHRI